ncbi:NFACT RNA binding domain-containing protein [Dyadobacter sp. NIV53]|uniref:NFACT RNA binding domain-containing protein n=1 Tax=Dyadobacter sp. NIV53 TaxID=2861765 RepID=UPI001C8839AA|nr:NFACT RNA binding domain-containing protein [Dyadobacter sp. NIV53]
MHQNYYFLKKLAPQLHTELAGKLLIETFSQEKDELILVFAESETDGILQNPFFIKATLRSNFACLSFPDKFDRARRNSVNLFTSFYGQKVNGVRVFLNERAIEIRFRNQTLVFKLFGNRSNIIAFDVNYKVTELFNNKLAADYSLTPASLDRSIDQTFDAYIQSDLRHETLFPTFGKLVNTHLRKLLEGESVPEKRWKIIQNLLQDLSKPEFYITRIELTPALSLLSVGEVEAKYDKPIEALNAFYYAYIRLNGIEKEKAEIIRILNKRIQQTDHYLENTFKKLVQLEEGGRNDEMANILMANLHQIPARIESIELFDFYHDKPIKIKLKKDLSPQKNAENYYRKSKNEKIELSRLNDSLQAREAEKIKMQGYLAAIEKIEILRELRTFIKTNALNGPVNSNAVTVAELFKKVEFMGYTILIGRNAKNNDVLTKQYAFKEDLWLHARDVSGSHVIIKNQPGKKFPSPVIERAAELAAFYSKRKTDSLCPVIVTPKKYVRKLKGMPEGAVIVDKEDVIMVVAKGE